MLVVQPGISTLFTLIVTPSFATIYIRFNWFLIMIFAPLTGYSKKLAILAIYYYKNLAMKICA